MDESMRRSTKKARPGTAGTSSRCCQFGSPQHRNTQQNQEIDEVLSPSLRKATLDDANRRSDSDLSTDGSPPSHSDDSEDDDCNDSDNSDDSEDEYSEDEYKDDTSNDDKYINFAISHDGLEQDDEVDATLADCDHDFALDSDGKKLHCLEGVVKDANALLDIVKGDFEKTYRRHADSKDEERKGMKGLIRKIVELIVFVESVNISDYDTGRQLEEELNNKRNDIGEAMVEALKDNGHSDLIINLGSRFSLDTLIVFYLHYAPIGCRPVDGDKWNYCDPDQCCIHTMMKKLFNFLINEEEHGPEKMKEWAFGGGQVEDKSSNMAAVDLIPILLDKKDNDNEMRKQYEEVATKLGLDSFYDLMCISFCFVQMHVKLFEKRKAEEEEVSKLQIHTCFSATSKYIYGFTNGIDKYLQTYQTSSFQQTFGFHPQCWLMGTNKNRNAFSSELIEVMTCNLVSVYSVLHDFRDNFQSQIMDVFGSHNVGIAIAMYNRLGKMFGKKNLLNLDALARASGEDVEAYVMTILSEHEISHCISSFIVDEMKTNDIERVMDRIRRCNAGQRMQYIASQIPLDGTLSESMKSMIEQLSKTLRQKYENVLTKLQNVRRNQDSLALRQQLAAIFRSAGDDESGRNAVVGHSDFPKFLTVTGLDEDAAINAVKAASRNLDSLAIRQQLAAIFRSAGDDESGRNAVVGHSDFPKFLTVTGLDEDAAINAVKAASRNQDSLAIRQQLAAIFRSAGDDESGRNAVVGHSDFPKFLTVTGLDEDAAINAVKAASRNLDSLAIRLGTTTILQNRLAKVYNDADSKQDGCGIDAVKCDDDFKEFCKVTGLSHDDAIERVLDIARGFCETFWRNFNELKVYRDRYSEDVMTVDEKRILTVDQNRSGMKYAYLYQWMMSMNGYHKKFNTRENEYGFYAYQQMGSLEQIALAGLDVCFDPDTMKKAIDKRTFDRVIETHDKDGTKRDIMNWGWDD